MAATSFSWACEPCGNRGSLGRSPRWRSSRRPCPRPRPPALMFRGADDSLRTVLPNVILDASGHQEQLRRFGQEGSVGFGAPPISVRLWPAGLHRGAQRVHVRFLHELHDVVRRGYFLVSMLGVKGAGQGSGADNNPKLILHSCVLLIRLFQQAPRCRVGRGPAAVSEESASVSGGVRDRGGLPEVPGCLSLARRVPLSSVWASAGLHSRAETTVAVRGVSTPGLVDVRNGAPQYEDPADGLVLGCVPDDN